MDTFCLRNEMNDFGRSEDLHRGKSQMASHGHKDGGTFWFRGKMKEINSNRSVCGYYFINLRQNWTIPRARYNLIDPLHRMLKKNGKITKRKMGNQDLAFLIVILLFLMPPGQTGESPSNYSRPSAKVCGTVDVRNRISNFDVLKDCEVIEGNLQIVLITNMRCEQCTEQLNSISFPKLREVTGYVVFWRVFGLRSLRNLFPNLSVIRGRLLFQNYALVVFEMDSLEEIGLYSLTHILRGSVLFDKNAQLCFVNTINWDMIAKQGAKRHYIGVSRPEHECPKCPEISSSNEVCPLSNSGKPLCWNRDHCQKDIRQCVKSTDGECCHKSCLGGCNGKSSKDCFACKGVVLNNECLEKCPQNTYKYFDRRCVTANECLNTRKPYDWETRELNKTFPFRLVGESCLMECPANFHEEEMESKTGAKRYKCVPCKGRCKKECEGAKVENIASIQKLYGCTHIVGSLEIQLPYEGNIVEELENSLSSIEEISGYLKVVRSLPLVSLDFLKNLKVIRGEQLESNRSAFVLLDNENLEELWDWSIRDQEIRILKGRLAFHYNPKLCFEKLEKFNEIAKLPPFTNEEVPRGTNGDRVACNITPLEPYIANNTPNMVLIKWKHFQHYDQRKLLGYVIYYTEAPYRNVSFYHNRNVCGGDGWHTDDISIPEAGNNDEMSHPLTLLKPYTQYAYYIKTYAIRSEKSGAQSKIHYFITDPGTPTEPEDLQAYSNSTSEIVISWSPPAKSNGNLTHYEIAGYARKDKILEGIDFCSEPRMVAVDKKPLPMAPTSSPKQDNGHCVCAPQIPEKTGIKDTEDIRTTKIDFEDALQNVYFVRKSNRKKREMTYSDSNHQQQLVHQNPGIYGKTSGEKQESSEILAFSQVTQLNTTQAVIKNLNYFTNYRVEVRACREVVEGEDGKQSPCSEKRTIEVRTKKNDNADNIPEISLTLDTVNGTLEETRLRWEEPRNPNGLILSYQIEYRRVDNDKYKAVIECITRQKFLEQKKEYVLKNLVPGNYTVHVLASSLAGDGPYSQAMSFFIPTSSRSALADIWPGVIGAFIVSGLFFGFFILWKKKTNGVPKLFANVNPEYVSAATVYVPDEWEVPRKNIELIRELGQGSFGMVYEGIARDIVQGQPEVRCAVKTVNEVATDRDRMEFLNEASVMKAFNTHHVVQLLGVVSEGQPTLVVMELMVNGDLKTYLRSHRPEFCEDKKRQPPTLKRILKMAIEIADGMAYLAAKKFVHRDLAARNCMVAEDLTVKIGDFGMTRDIYETDYYKKGTKGLLPVRWMAPESLKDGVFTSHSDVWSYGVVLWEMVTLASQPYQGLSNDQVLRYVIEGGVMEKPENCPDKLYELMKMCWHYKPMARPHFMDFVTALLPDASPEFCKNSYYHSSDGRELRAHLESAETEVILPTSETPLRLATDIEDFSVGGSEQELDEDEEEAELDVEPPLMSPQRGILTSSSRSENWLKGSAKPAALASVSSSDSSRASKLSNGGANTPVNGYIIGRSSNDTRTTQC